jgi:hypothetical protein
MRRNFDQRALIETKALKLAWSGEHQSFASIKAVLQRQGYEGVDRLFANRWTRSELDRICEKARKVHFAYL